MAPPKESVESDKAEAEAALASSRFRLKHVIGEFIDEADGIELAALGGVLQTFALDRLNKLLAAHEKTIISPEPEEGEANN